MSPHVGIMTTRHRSSAKCSGIYLIISLKTACLESFRAIPSAYECILMIFALKGAMVIWKETEGLTGTELLRVLIIDQALYFLMYVYTSILDTQTIIHAEYPVIVLFSAQRLISSDTLWRYPGPSPSSYRPVDNLRHFAFSVTIC